MERPQAESPKRCRGDAGTALVELALILTPLCMLLFGIIVYGYLMSFRQNMTQAAAEGARAGAVAPPTAAYDQAMDATDQAVHSFGKACGSDGTSCQVAIGNCPNSTATTPPQCVTVTVTYDYANHPLMPSVPLVSSFIPGTFTSTFSAQVNS